VVLIVLTSLELFSTSSSAPTFNNYRVLPLCLDLIRYVCCKLSASDIATYKFTMMFSPVRYSVVYQSRARKKFLRFRCLARILVVECFPFPRPYPNLGDNKRSIRQHVCIHSCMCHTRSTSYCTRSGVGSQEWWWLSAFKHGWDTNRGKKYLRIPYIK
jgi:hypothetical protein